MGAGRPHELPVLLLTGQVVNRTRLGQVEHVAVEVRLDPFVAREHLPAQRVERGTEILLVADYVLPTRRTHRTSFRPGPGHLPSRRVRSVLGGSVIRVCPSSAFAA